VDHAKTVAPDKLRLMRSYIQPQCSVTPI